MSIDISQFPFAGPYYTVDELENSQGIYIITDTRNGRHFGIDVGESTDIKSRVMNHERSSCWSRNSSGQLGVMPWYTPGYTNSERRAQERIVRALLEPPCGEY